MAVECDWYTKDGKPYESRISGYKSGNKFSLDGYAWILYRVWDMSLDEFLVAAIGTESVEQVEINRVSKELTPAQNQMVRNFALQFAEINRKEEKLKAQNAHLRAELRKTK